MEKEHVYEQTYRDYLSRISGIDLKFAAAKLDLQMSGEAVIIPFFGKSYRVSTEGIADPQSFLFQGGLINYGKCAYRKRPQTFDRSRNGKKLKSGARQGTQVAQVFNNGNVGSKQYRVCRSGSVCVVVDIQRIDPHQPGSG